MARRSWQYQVQKSGYPLNKDLTIALKPHLLAVLKLGGPEDFQQLANDYKRELCKWKAKRAKGHKKARKPRRSWVWSAFRPIPVSTVGNSSLSRTYTLEQLIYFAKLAAEQDKTLAEVAVDFDLSNPSANATKSDTDEKAA